MKKRLGTKRPVSALVWVTLPSGKSTQVRRGSAEHRAARPQDFGTLPSLGDALRGPEGDALRSVLAKVGIELPVERFEVRLPDGTVRDAVAVVVTGGAS